MITPKKRWLTLPEAEAVLDGRPDARKAIVAGCVAGEIESRVEIDYDTGFEACDPIEWRDAEIAWESSRIKTRTRMLGSRKSYETPPCDWCHVQINLSSLVAYFQITKKTSAKLGGRPRKYDWEDFFIELAAHVIRHGLPGKQADLENRMMQWCIDTWGDQPSVSEVRKRVAKALRAIEARLKT